jgi:crotonobetainyl-CoA:carnitine CoA-transferase CaiB-like acyl-CoA transferase
MSQKDDGVRWSDWIRERNDPRTASTKPEALDHLTVLDCSYASMAGCFASSYLGEFGAEVIRIEPPEGDPARDFSPWGFKHKGTGLAYLNEGRNKYHVTLNLKEPAGREVFKTLAKRADVVIETFLPGTMDGWGIGYRQLRADNPRLIYCALYTYGQFGAKASCGKADVDVVNQAYSGVTAVSGEPANGDGKVVPSEVPTKAGNWMGWYAGGAWAALAILAASHHRNHFGKGQFIDISPAEAFGRNINYALTYWQGFKEVIPRVGNLDVGIFPYTFFKCKDGYAFLAGFADINWKAFCTIIGRLDLQERYPTIFDRLNLDNMKVMYAEIEKWTLARTYDEIFQAVMHYNKTVGVGVVVPGKLCAPKDTMATQNWWERGTLLKSHDPHYGELTIANLPQKMTATPPRVKWVCRPVGADNEYIYNKKLAWGPTKLTEMKGKGII